MRSPESKHRSPLDVVYQLALLAGLSILLGDILPGIVAYESGVYDAESMLQRVKSRHPEIKAALSQYADSQNQARKALAKLDTEVIAGTNPSVNVAALRQSYIQELAKPAPISIQPFRFHLVLLCYKD